MTIKAEYQEGSPLPESIGRCADLYAEVRELRLAMDKVVEGMKKRESEIREYIIQNLSKSDDTGAAGKAYRAQIVKKVKPSVKDWEKLYDFIVENDRFDLLQKRVAEKAVKDLWDDGADVPGVERFNVVDVSITKI